MHSCDKQKLTETKMVAMGNGAGASQRKERKSRDRKLSRSIKRIRADMVEISKGHKRIKEGQEEVRERFEEISKEAAKLKEETNLISKQSAANQVRLDLMFQIVKARSENDTAMDAVLTQTLRDLMASKSKLPDVEKKEQDSAP
ncbi:uncharacterized protein [Populus alba]|nr:uncharacterized protein LOC118049126 [Populus alba]KAJ7004398.1 hypothetical protein NC653_009312 [Populus alba x Populus x berolinensis]